MFDSFTVSITYEIRGFPPNKRKFLFFTLQIFKKYYPIRIIFFVVGEGIFIYVSVLLASLISALIFIPFVFRTASVELLLRAFKHDSCQKPTLVLMGR